MSKTELLTFNSSWKHRDNLFEWLHCVQLSSLRELWYCPGVKERVWRVNTRGGHTQLGVTFSLTLDANINVYCKKNSVFAVIHLLQIFQTLFMRDSHYNLRGTFIPQKPNIRKVRAHCLLVRAVSLWNSSPEDVKTWSSLVRLKVLKSVMENVN